MKDLAQRASGRLLSLDVFRGITMACMVLVENPGNWTIYGPLRHARWGMAGADGMPVHEAFTPTDLVMPFFLFIVGVSVVFALGRGKSDPDARRVACRKLGWRSLRLYVFGVVLTTFPSALNACLYGGEFSLEPAGVLQRIALVYGACGLLFLFFSGRTLIGLGVGFLFLYWGLLSLPVPGYPEPLFFRQYFTPGQVPSCFPEWVDAKVLGFANPCGILSTLPAIVTGLIGVLAGILLKRDVSPGTKVLGLAVSGVVLLLVGYGWSQWLPIIKDLWTSTYVLVSGGYALLGLALAYWAIDGKGWDRWAPPAVAYGVNCFGVYVLSHLVAATLHVIRIGAGEETRSLHQVINDTLFGGWLSGANASLAFALLAVGFWFIPLWMLYRRGIVVKV